MAKTTLDRFSQPALFAAMEANMAEHIIVDPGIWTAQWG
jgi:hypothetical protein